MEAKPCIYCGRKPHTHKYMADIYYQQCDCGKWDLYEFCGSSEKNSILCWNTSNNDAKFKFHEKKRQKAS